MDAGPNRGQGVHSYDDRRYDRSGPRPRAVDGGQLGCQTTQAGARRLATHTPVTKTQILRLRPSYSGHSQNRMELEAPALGADRGLLNSRWLGRAGVHAEVIGVL